MKSTWRSRLPELASEIGRKGYFARAQERAARRKSRWNLLDLPIGIACMTLVALASLRLIWAARNLVIPSDAAPFSLVLHS
jgi:hypothetical protein